MIKGFEMDTLHSKKDFAGVVNLRILRWREYPGLSGRAQNNHKTSYKEEVGWGVGAGGAEGDVMTEAEGVKSV